MVVNQNTGKKKKEHVGCGARCSIIDSPRGIIVVDLPGTNAMLRPHASRVLSLIDCQWYLPSLLVGGNQVGAGGPNPYSSSLYEQ